MQARRSTRTYVPLVLALVASIAALSGACITKTTPETLTMTEYNAIYARLSQQVFTNAGGGNQTQARGDFVGGVVRLLFHDAGEFSATAQDGLRSDGCVDLSKADNGGLAHVINGLSLLWAEFCEDISRADFWVLAAKVAIEMSGPSGNNAYPLNYQIPFRIGRVDRETCTYDGHRLPSAEKGFSEVRRSLMDNLGLSKKEAIALLGAHCLGRAERKNSGYSGVWVKANNVFQNSFYNELLHQHWAKVELGGEPPLIQWDTDISTIMLNTDMSLAFDIGADANSSVDMTTVNRCKPISVRGFDRNNCPLSSEPENPVKLVQNFASDNNDFLWTFAEAFKKISEKGYVDGDLVCFGDIACSSTRPKCKDSDWVDARGRNCNWVAAKPATRCANLGTPSGVFAWKGCPLACSSCITPRCTNDPSWNTGVAKRNCAWAAQNPLVRCMIVGLSGERAYAACPEACSGFTVCA